MNRTTGGIASVPRLSFVTSLFGSIDGPADLKRVDAARCRTLAEEIREFLVESVSRTGGHLGPNLGVVELTMAVHRVFDSPRDAIVWDTGHQAYVHKLLTGRRDDFTTLRQADGLSGYPSRAESVHDWVENSHASTALSYADGLAKAFAVRGETDRAVVAIIGDGSLTGGMCWEALNTIAATTDRPVVIVVNDNGRSYAPTVGGWPRTWPRLRLSPSYEQVLDMVRTSLSRTPVVGAPIYEALHGMKKGLKDLIQPQVMFEDLGLKYVGPIDGHDVAAVERALRNARDFGAPGDRPLPDREGPRLPAGRRRRGRPVPQRQRHRPAHRTAGERPQGRPGPTSSPSRCLRSAASATTSSGSPPPCFDRSGCTALRRSSRTACSMSASPSSTR